MAGNKQPKTGTFPDPYRNFNFYVEIQGLGDCYFTDVKGMGMRVQAIPYRQGGIGQVVHHLPGRAENAFLELTYGLTESREVFDWFMSAVKGTVERRNLSLVLLGTDGSTEQTRWNFFRCWVAEWNGAPCEALGQTTAIESVKIVFETMERV